MRRFCGYEQQNDANFQEKGCFLGYEGESHQLPRKEAFSWTTGWENKKGVRYAHYSRALQRRVIRVSETFEESRSSGDARPEQGEWSVCP